MLNTDTMMSSKGHAFVKKPWGGYLILKKSPRYWLKKLFVKKGEQLSLQSHRNRYEMWILLQGTVRIQKGSVFSILQEGECLRINKKEKHRMYGLTDASILEAAFGEPKEGDIIRYEDAYGRITIGQGGKIEPSSWLLERHAKRTALEDQAKKLLAKKAIVFDLDGTLTESKKNLDKEMASLLCALLKKKKVAVMGGGNYGQFQKQFLARLPCAKTSLENLFILPASGSSFFTFQKNHWRKAYQHRLSEKEKTGIMRGFETAFKDIGYIQPKKTYGTIIEDRESQITFSALGQKAPFAQKEKWNKETDMRRELKTALEKHLPEFEVRLGGLTSIDITKKGVDKALGITEIIRMLAVSSQEIAYIGDALYEGGNDAVILQTGIDAIQVSGPEEVRCLIRQLL